MGYIKALEAAGAEVHDTGRFGSYQGTYIAKVTVDGENGFITWSFGSCSYCDSWRAEFGVVDEEFCDDHWLEEQAEDCEACSHAFAAYMPRLIAFGQSYLKRLSTAEEVIREHADDAEWDVESGDIIEWVKARS